MKDHESSANMYCSLKLPFLYKFPDLIPLLHYIKSHKNLQTPKLMVWLQATQQISRATAYRHLLSLVKHRYIQARGRSSCCQYRKKWKLVGDTLYLLHRISQAVSAPFHTRTSIVTLNRPIKPTNSRLFAKFKLHMDSLKAKPQRRKRPISKLHEWLKFERQYRQRFIRSRLADVQ